MYTTVRKCHTAKLKKAKFYVKKNDRNSILPLTKRAMTSHQNCKTNIKIMSPGTPGLRLSSTPSFKQGFMLQATSNKYC